MVDLEEMGAEDWEWLEDIIMRHYEETGSAVAARILERGVKSVNFVKVMPRDYKRVLRAAAEAAAAGIPVEEAVMAAAHG
jgi:glutamate synthase (NADPH/NADH) large chain